MLPYMPQFFPENYLVTLYSKLKEQDLLDLVFPGGETFTLNGFVSYMAGKKLLSCWMKDGEKLVLIGGGWLVSMEGIDGARKGVVGFYFFKEGWAKRETRDLSRFMLKYWFAENKIDILYATSLVENKLAVNFARNYGFKYQCLLPKYFVYKQRLEDAHLITLTAEDFEPIWQSAYPS